MKRIVLGAAALIVIIGATFFAASNQPTSTNVKVGVIAPLSDQYAFLGESERNAMLMAQQDLKEQGVTVDLIFEDDAYDTKKGLSAYQKLTNVDNVDAIIAVSAPILEALRPVVAEDNTLLFSLGESLFHEDDTVFQLMPAVDKIGPRLGEEASKRYDRIAVVYSSSGSLWQEWRDDFIGGADASDTIETFALPPNSDLRTETQKVLAFNPEATTVFLPLEDGIKYLQNLKVFDPEHAVDLICDGNIEFSIGQYVAEVGENVFGECISTTLPDTMTEEFVTNYKEQYGVEPVLTADYAYDAVGIIAELSRYDSPRWVETLKNNYTYHGASGEIKFNEVGTRLPEVVVHQFKNGVFIKIE